MRLKYRTKLTSPAGVEADERAPDDGVVRALRERRAALLSALDTLDAASIERAIDQRVASYRDLPKREPEPGPPGWLSVRVVGVPEGHVAAAPLPAVELELRGGGEDPTSTRARTDVLGHALVPLPTGDELVLHVLDDAARSIHAHALTPSDRQPTLLLALERCEEIGPSFAAAARYESAMVAAEAQAEQSKREHAAAREAEQAFLNAELSAVNRALEGSPQKETNDGDPEDQK